MEKYKFSQTLINNSIFDNSFPIPEEKIGNNKISDGNQINNYRIDFTDDKIIKFSDYTNHLLNYPIQNIFWNGNRNNINNDQLSRSKEVLKFIKILKYDQDNNMVFIN
jgi:hypothetical protein